MSFHDSAPVSVGSVVWLWKAVHQGRSGPRGTACGVQRPRIWARAALPVREGPVDFGGPRKRVSKEKFLKITIATNGEFTAVS